MNTSRVAAEGFTVNELLSTAVSEPLLARSTFAPAKSMLSPLNTATPLVSVSRLVVPLNVPVPPARAMATGTSGTPLVKSSTSLTVTAGAIASPATTSEGCCMNPIWPGFPGLTANAALSTSFSPSADANKR